MNETHARSSRAFPPSWPLQAIGTTPGDHFFFLPGTHSISRTSITATCSQLGIPLKDPHAWHLFPRVRPSCSILRTRISKTRKKTGDNADKNVKITFAVKSIKRYITSSPSRTTHHNTTSASHHEHRITSSRSKHNYISYTSRTDHCPTHPPCQCTFALS